MTKEKRIWLYRIVAIVFLAGVLVFAGLEVMKRVWPSQQSAKQETSVVVPTQDSPTYREMNIDEYAMDPAYQPTAMFPEIETGRIANPEYASKFSFWVFANAEDGSTFLFNYHSGMVANIENYRSHQESFDGARMVWMTAGTEGVTGTEVATETKAAPGILYFGEYSGYHTKIADGVWDYTLSPDGNTVYFTTQGEADLEKLELKVYNLSNSTTRPVRTDLQMMTPAENSGEERQGHKLYAAAFDGRLVTFEPEPMEVHQHESLDAEGYRNLSVLGTYGRFLLFPLYAATASAGELNYYLFDDNGRIGYAVLSGDTAVHLGSFSQEERHKILFNRNGAEALVISDSGTYLYKGTERKMIHRGWVEPLLNHRAAVYRLADNILVYGVTSYENILYAIQREEAEMPLYNLATFSSDKLNVFSVSTSLPLLSADGSKFTMNQPHTAVADFRASAAAVVEDMDRPSFGIRSHTVYCVSEAGRISYVTPTEGYRFDWNAEGVNAMDSVSFATNASGNVQIAIVSGDESEPVIYITNFSQSSHLSGKQTIQAAQVEDVFFGDRLFYVARDGEFARTLAMVVVSEQQFENESLENEYVEDIKGYHWFGQSAVCINADGILVFMGNKIIQTDLRVTSFFD